MLTGTTLAGADGSPLLPLGGLSDNLLFTLDGSDVLMRRSDKYGFNNPTDHWGRAGVEVMAVGVSFTFGADVPFRRSFMDLLRNEVGPTVNFGCGGNGPLSELAALIEYGTILRPKTLIWAYFEGNDLTKDIRRELSPHYSRLAADLSEARGIGRVDSGFRGGFSLRVGD